MHKHIVVQYGRKSFYFQNVHKAAFVYLYFKGEKGSGGILTGFEGEGKESFFFFLHSGEMGLFKEKRVMMKLMGLEKAWKSSGWHEKGKMSG